MSVFDRLVRLTRAELNHRRRDGERTPASGLGEAGPEIEDLHDPATADLSRSDDDRHMRAFDRALREGRPWPEETGPGARRRNPRAGRGPSGTTRDAGARTEPRAGSRSRRPPPSYPEEVREAYRTLGLTVGSDREAVRRAFRDLARRHHPDRHAGDADAAKGASERLIRIRRARDRVERWLDGRG